jgi:predicted deacetylase
MLGDLAGVGLSVTSLLVIPNHHHKGRIDQDAAFASWLRDQVSCGHEAVLHGFYHLRTGRQTEGLVTQLITRCYTAGEGEFYDISFEAAEALLREGKESLNHCGVGTTGFIAPAWLLGVEAERAVRKEGFNYTTRITKVIDCRKGKEFAARSMVYSVRAKWRRATSLLWNDWLFQRLQSAPLLRIGLHPPDWQHERIRSHILRCVKKALLSRQATTYRDWLDLDPYTSH